MGCFKDQTSWILLKRCRRLISKSSHPDSENNYPFEKAQPRHEDAGGGGEVFPNKEKDSFERKNLPLNQAGLLSNTLFLFFFPLIP
jgi:hypothetical protein